MNNILDVVQFVLIRKLSRKTTVFYWTKNYRKELLALEALTTLVCTNKIN